MAGYQMTCGNCDGQGVLADGNTTCHGCGGNGQLDAHEPGQAGDYLSIHQGEGATGADMAQPWSEHNYDTPGFGALGALSGPGTLPA